MTDNTSGPTLDELTGKYILIGITYVGHEDNVIGQYEYHGHFESMDEVIHIRLEGSGEDFTLPPDLSAFQPAQPGEYQLRTTGKVVVDPDYTCVWTVHAPPPESQPMY